MLRSEFIRKSEGNRQVSIFRLSRRRIKLVAREEGKNMQSNFHSSSASIADLLASEHVLAFFRYVFSDSALNKSLLSLLESMKCSRTSRKGVCISTCLIIPREILRNWRIWTEKNVD